jgi:hypothetical protein
VKRIAQTILLAGFFAALWPLLAPEVIVREAGSAYAQGGRCPRWVVYRYCYRNPCNSSWSMICCWPNNHCTAVVNSIRSVRNAVPQYYFR